MKKAIVFGLGSHYDSVKDWIFNNYDVVGLSDNSPKQREARRDEGLIIEPTEINSIDFDFILIPTYFDFTDDILIQLVGMGIPLKKMVVPLIYSYFKPCQFGTIDEYKGIKIRINTYSDALIFRDIFIHGDYPSPPFEQENYAVVDIGMNVGMASLFYANFENVKNVYSYEVVEETYKVALLNFELNKHISPKITAYNYGLGHENVNVSIEKSNYSGSASIFSTSCSDADKLMLDCTVKKASDVLSVITERHRGKEKLLMKIDCEGAEWGIFDDLFHCGLLCAFDFIVGEWHIFSDMDKNQMLSKLKHQLKDAGFVRLDFKSHPTSDMLGFFIASKA